jgi:hypothetical protein
VLLSPLGTNDEGFCWVAVKRKNEKLENLMGGNMLKKTVTIFALDRGKSQRENIKNNDINL